jgi:hypothetical protein
MHELGKLTEAEVLYGKALVLYRDTVGPPRQPFVCVVLGLSKARRSNAQASSIILDIPSPIARFESCTPGESVGVMPAESLCVVSSWLPTAKIRTTKNIARNATCDCFSTYCGVITGA